MKGFYTLLVPLSIAALLCLPAYSDEATNPVSEKNVTSTVPTTELLTAYLERNRELQTQLLEVDKISLSYASTKISNGFDITLSTGTMRLTADSSGTKASITPSVTASIPQAQGLELSAGSSITFSSDGATAKDTSIEASVDIISAAALNREISLLKAERSVIEAQRALEQKALEVEKSFYTELEGLLSSINSIMSKRQTLYDDQLDFETIKAKGYSASSPTYRKAQTKVYTDTHEIETGARALIHDYIVFYKKCGYNLRISEDEDFTRLIPQDILQAELLDIHDFSPESYTETEAAVWTNKINTMQRQAKNKLSLSANGGYTFSNSSTSSDTVDAGVQASWGGLTVGAGTNIPVTGESKTPSFTLSAKITPNTFRQNQITKEQDELSEEQEKIKLFTARINFGTAVVSAEQKKSDLLWEKETLEEGHDLYAQQESDLYQYFRQGVITESEYLAAKNTMQSYQVKKIINLIDFLIYNDEIRMKFVD